MCHSCNNVFTYSSVTHPEGYLKYVTASGKLIVTRYDHLLSIPRTVQREFFSKKQHTQVNHVSSCFITQGAVVCFSLFPPPRVPITPPSPVTPSPTTDKSTPLHKPSLFKLSYSCEKTFPQLLDENLLLQYLFLCRASVDVVVPRARRGGETASVMRMVAPH